MASELVKHISTLRVPENFARYENVTDAEQFAQLEAWKQRAHIALRQLKSYASKLSTNDTTLEETAAIVTAVAVFDGDDVWIEDDLRNPSQEILSALSISQDIVRHVLQYRVKPLFLATPHPDVNLSTGRKLPRSAGGPTATIDYFDDQTWKINPGTSNLVAWCIAHTVTESYESFWPLLIPPVMTLLDDYQAEYRLKGTHLVSAMLTTVPPELLKRTGVGQLFLSSLMNTLSHLHDKLTPALIRAAVPTILHLIDISTKPNTSERFDQQSTLLGGRIIGSIWLYAPHDIETIEASLDVLPAILDALGIGSARFMKAVIPQCVHMLVSHPEQKTPASMHSAALRALDAVIKQCQPRIYRWKGTIIDGVARCWVNTVDSGKDTIEARNLKERMKGVLHELALSCPSVKEVK